MSKGGTLLTVESQWIDQIIDEQHDFLMKDVELSPKHGMPVLHSSPHDLPKRIITFTQAKSPSWIDYDCWVCFYEADKKFMCFWNNPLNYLERLQKFKGVISPDFSLSINADEEDQYRQFFCGRLLAAWLEQNGIPVVTNIRYANRFSQPFCCEGVPKHAMIAIGTNGFLRDREFRQIIAEGVDFAVATVEPKAVLVYGGCPNNIFGKHIQRGINIIPYKAQIKIAHEASEFRKKKEKIQALDAKQGRLF